MAAMLILCCGFMGLTASTAPPAACTVDLFETTSVQIANFTSPNRDIGSSVRPSHLRLDGLPMLDKVHYLQLDLGDPPRPFCLVFGPSGVRWINVLYFDGNGDGTITPYEQVEVTCLGPFSDAKYQFWIAEPLRPLRAEVEYRRADGTAFTRSLALDVELIAVQNTSAAKGSDTSYGAAVFPGTYFVGEIPAGNDRVYKVLVYDGNNNGLFNEGKHDFLLIDKNFDNVFDWKKERTALEKSLSGLDLDGKRTKLRAFVAAWPRKLCLAPVGSSVDLTALEAE